MNVLDSLKDCLYNEIYLQKFYNEQATLINNPEVRQLFSQLRDEQMQHITELQIRIEEIEAKLGVVNKIITSIKNN